MPEAPSTVLKALSLLDFFNERRPAIGLSEFAKLSGNNKASTLRFLTALQSKGFVEQDDSTKSYRVGPAFLRFAQLREAIVPLGEAVQQVLGDLSAATQETAHASVIAGESLANIGTVESKRANRISIEPGEAIPFHATASGLAFLAFAPAQFVETALSRNLTAHASETETDSGKLRAELKAIRARGVAKTSSSYEDGATGIAAPYFGPDGKVSGAVAVAMPTTRATDESEDLMTRHVRIAARRLTELHGGQYPEIDPDRAPDSTRNA